MKHLGLFEGIGGFSLAARWAGWETVAWCEWNEFCQKVLRYHFPDAEGYGDITKTDFTKYANTIDIITGGFPCQPYSTAGKRKGKDDDRHLWPEMLRAIREVQPRWVVGENVRGLTNWNGGLVFDEVQADLEAEGYEVLPFLLPSCAVNAPHRRDRIWFVAHSNNTGAGEQLRVDGNGTEENERWKGQPQPELGKDSRDVADTKNIGYESSGSTREWRSGFKDSNSGDAANPNSGRQSGKEYWKEEPGQLAKESISNYWQNFPTQSPVCSGNDGLSSRLDGITFSKWRNESIKAYGNRNSTPSSI